MSAEPPIDYSFKAQCENFAQNWRDNFEEAYGMPYEEILKDKALVAQIDAGLNRMMWDMGTSPSPFGA